MSKSDPTADMPLEGWTGVIVAFHTCDWCAPRDGAWRGQEANSVSALSTLRLVKATGRVSVRIPWPRWVAATEKMFTCLMSQWYRSCLVPAPCLSVDDSHPHRIHFWLQDARLPDPQKSGGRKQMRTGNKNGTTCHKQAKVCTWKVVTANVLTFQPAVEQSATGFFASGRRLD